MLPALFLKLEVWNQIKTDSTSNGPISSWQAHGQMRANSEVHVVLEKWIS